MTSEDEFLTLQRNGTANDPGAGTTLVGPVEYTTSAVLTYLKIDSGEANWFDLVELDQDGANAETLDRVRKSSDGELVLDGDVENPVLDLNADQEFEVQVADAAAGAEYSATIRIKEHQA